MAHSPFLVSRIPHKTLKELQTRIENNIYWSVICAGEKFYLKAKNKQINQYIALTDQQVEKFVKTLANRGVQIKFIGDDSFEIIYFKHPLETSLRPIEHLHYSASFNQFLQEQGYTVI